jgi:hypothetical protein
MTLSFSLQHCRHFSIEQFCSLQTTLSVTTMVALTSKTSGPFRRILGLKYVFIWMYDKDQNGMVFCCKVITIEV